MPFIQMVGILGIQRHFLHLKVLTIHKFVIVNNANRPAGVESRKMLGVNTGEHLAKGVKKQTAQVNSNPYGDRPELYKASAFIPCCC